jgi:hypothetical protein
MLVGNDKAVEQIFNLTSSKTRTRSKSACLSLIQILSMPLANLVPSLSLHYSQIFPYHSNTQMSATFGPSSIYPLYSMRHFAFDTPFIGSSCIRYTPLPPIVQMHKVTHFWILSLNQILHILSSPSLNNSTHQPLFQEISNK